MSNYWPHRKNPIGFLADISKIKHFIEIKSSDSKALSSNLSTDRRINQSNNILPIEENDTTVHWANRRFYEYL